MAFRSPSKRLDELPDEILLRILCFLEPFHFPRVQLVCRKLQKISLDNNHWRSRTFDESPFLEALQRRRQTFEGPPLSPVVAQLTQEYRRTEAHSHLQDANTVGSQRQRDMANWDPSFPTEPVFWYNEYIQRYAPAVTSWLQQPRKRGGTQENTLEVRGMALYCPNVETNELLAVSPLEDGSVCLWDVKGTRGRKGAMIEKGRDKALFRSGLSTVTNKSGAIDTAVTECISVDNFADKAFVAVQGHLFEVDLSRLDIVSEQPFEWSIKALSSAAPGLPLTVGTSLGIHLFDYRARTRVARDIVERIDVLAVESPTGWSERNVVSAFESDPLPVYAPLSQPTPLSILHLPNADDENSFSDDIYVAGRFSNILHYDRRRFPSIVGSIHSGARLASLACLPYPFSTLDSETRRRGELSIKQVKESKQRTGGRTLIAAGEYNTKGSLELYGLSTQAGNAHGELMQNSTMKNRQTSSQSKILSVTNHGTKIVFSDGSGLLKWFERDGFTEVRRHRIGHSEVPGPSSLFGSMPDSDDFARKILSTQTRSGVNNVNDDDIIFWTGEKVGLVSFSSKPGFVSDDFEEERQMSEEQAQVEDAEKEPTTLGSYRA
ncbi:hypothetical protein CTRI78_v002369 [Colletotrichum trifolii]|uniref:F-box domain-containing protein n=1 Tax=Colletotrichum trifolii TaxID=5466 RepID=A0A4R8RRQ5_COLTR|nr:hypothetical protein CTRI78_v002369 [Colletotrichum trifolii]